MSFSFTSSANDKRNWSSRNDCNTTKDSTAGSGSGSSLFSFERVNADKGVSFTAPSMSTDVSTKCLIFGAPANSQKFSFAAKTDADEKALADDNYNLRDKGSMFETSQDSVNMFGPANTSAGNTPFFGPLNMLNTSSGVGIFRSKSGSSEEDEESDDEEDEEALPSSDEHDEANLSDEEASSDEEAPTFGHNPTFDTSALTEKMAESVPFGAPDSKTVFSFASPTGFAGTKSDEKKKETTGEKSQHFGKGLSLRASKDPSGKFNFGTTKTFGDNNSKFGTPPSAPCGGNLFGSSPSPQGKNFSFEVSKNPACSPSGSMFGPSKKNTNAEETTSGFSFGAPTQKDTSFSAKPTTGFSIEKGAFGSTMSRTNAGNTGAPNFSSFGSSTSSEAFTAPSSSFGSPASGGATGAPTFSFGSANASNSTQGVFGTPASTHNSSNSFQFGKSTSSRPFTFGMKK